MAFKKPTKRPSCPNGHNYDQVGYNIKDGFRKCIPCKQARIQRQNMRRRGELEPAKDRTHCVNGHQYTQENVLVVRYDGRVYRCCKTCRNAAQKRWRKRHPKKHAQMQREYRKRKLRRALTERLSLG